MRILVFGGRGFVGRNVTKALVEMGHSVYVVDNLGVTPAEQLDVSKLKAHIQGDVTDPEVLSEAISTAQPEAIYWFPSIQGYTAPRHLFCDVNVRAPWLLMDAIEKWKDWRQLQRVILASSEAQYGPGSSVLESHEKTADSDYGVSKELQERVFFHLGRTFKVQVIALRYAIILGPGQSLDETQCGILRNWYHNRRRGLPAEVYGSGKQCRGFVHIEDVTRATLDALVCAMPKDYPQQMPINITGETATVIEMVELWKELTGCEYTVTNEHKRPGGEFTLNMDGSRAKRMLGFEARYGCRDMIRDFVESVDKTAAV